MLLIAFIVFAVWIAVSVAAGLLFGRMTTLNEQARVPRRGPGTSRPRAVPGLRIARDRAA
jgi:hypothetical protein